MSVSAQYTNEEFETIENIGHFLRATREKSKTSVAKVSQDTKIRTEWISYIENGDFDNLPGKVYAIGFVRTYAEYLELNADKIIETLQASPYFGHYNDTLLISAPPHPSKISFKVKTILISITAILALLSVFSYLKGDQDGLTITEQDEAD